MDYQVHDTRAERTVAKAKAGKPWVVCSYNHMGKAAVVGYFKTELGAHSALARLLQQGTK